MLWTTNSTSLLAKTIAKENINARQANLWEWGTFSEEVYVVNFPTSWMFIPFFVSFMDSFSFFFASRHEWHCTQEGKKIFLLSSTLQALTTSTGSQKLALLTLPGSPWTDLNTEPHHLFSIKGCCTKRDLYIVRNHGGCSEDTGWLDTASTNCNWEGKYPESTAFNRRPILPSHALVRENEGSW